jgi:ATP-binding cassette subfamily C protein
MPDQTGPEQLRNPLDLLRAHARGALTVMALAVASALTEGIGLVLIVPLLGVLGAQGAQGEISRLFGALGIMPALGPLLGLFVVLVSLRALLNHARTMAAQRLEIAVVDGLRRRAWHALLHCDWRELMVLRRSDSASLLITDIDRMAYGLNQALSAVSIAMTLGAILLAALVISPPITAGAALGGALVLVAYGGMRRRAHALGEALGKAYGQVHASLSEGLGALRAIKSFAGEVRAEAAALDSFAGLRSAQLAYVRDRGLGQLALQAGGALVLALLVWLAVERWRIGAAAVLPMVALFARAVPLLGQLQECWLNYVHARPALDEALAMVARAEAAREPQADGIAPPELTRAIELHEVGLRLGDGPAVLQAMTLTIPARGITALTGPSGAGKSSLADLIGGLLSPDEGAIAIDGTLLGPALRRAWRRRVAYVQQEPVLLAASVRDNLLWAAPQASEAELLAAIEAASARFVLALPHGLDTVLGDGGRGLSGGERQRLMLARALLRDPALLILDEATSALDAENEAQVAAAIDRLRDRMAIVVICHRGALLALADSVVTLDRGRMTVPGAA